MNEELIKQYAEEACGPEWYGTKPNIARGAGEHAIRLYDARAVAPLRQENAELRALVKQLTAQTKRDGERIGRLEAKVAPLVEAVAKLPGEWERQKGLFPELARDGWMSMAIENLASALAPFQQSVPSASPQPSPDVVRLVIAARKVAFEDQGPEALRELDKASEAFAGLVPWDGEPAPFQQEGSQ